MLSATTSGSFPAYPSGTLSLTMVSSTLGVVLERIIMRFSHFVVIAVSLAALGCAPKEEAKQAEPTHADHQVATVAHSQHEASKDGLKAVFHVDAPSQAAYTCPMHPEVVSDKPGTCPQCKMDLAKQTHRVALELKDSGGKPVQDAMVRLTVKDANNMVQGLDLKGDGTYQGAFHLVPGQQQMTAFVKPAGAAQAVELSIPYEVK